MMVSCSQARIHENQDDANPDRAEMVTYMKVSRKERLRKNLS